MSARETAVLAVVENRATAFALTQKIDVILKYIQKLEDIDAAIEKEEIKKTSTQKATRINRPDAQVAY